MSEQTIEPALLIFYTTAGCHLCDQADAIVRATLNPDFFLIEYQDIAEDDGLIEQYGVRIPVLKIASNGRELGWPFDQNQLVAFLSQE
ncbi:MAG: thioredoxin family protein [Gammaproteobacteria bacterium]|nr:MAG: thioredoxin family protein [Gammaproteobacteria bacterium]